LKDYGGDYEGLEEMMEVLCEEEEEDWCNHNNNTVVVSFCFLLVFLVREICVVICVCSESSVFPPLLCVKTMSYITLGFFLTIPILEGT
jgi:uncharacterized membrane protein YkgB